jgi:hypothetical protein
MPSKDQKNPEELNPFVTRMIDGTSLVYTYYRGRVLKPKSDAVERDPWELEKGLDPDYIGTPNIPPQTPEKECKRLFWRAVRASTSLSLTEEDVLRKMKLWNSANNPRVPEKRLEEMVRWAIKRWYPRLRKPK